MLIQYKYNVLLSFGTVYNISGHVCAEILDIGSCLEAVCTIISKTGFVVVVSGLGSILGNNSMKLEWGKKLINY